MSYILDALKKSEQERQEQVGPTLQTIQRPLTKNTNGTLLWLLVFIGVVLTAILIVTSWRYFGAINHQQPQTHTVTPETTLAAKAVQKQPALANQDTGSDFETISPSPTTPEPLPRVVEFADLPDPIQQEIPALIFSFHVYSDNPLKRTIIINKRRVKEGDRVADGLTLIEITVDGVVLKWKQFYFQIQVVEQW